MAYISVRTEGWTCEAVGTMKRFMNIHKGADAKENQSCMTVELYM